MNQIFRDPASKLKHIDACLLDASQYQKSNGLEDVELPNEAGTVISLRDVKIETEFCGRIFAAPLMIAPMTGGIQRGAELNRIWATMAERFQIPMGVGSQRLAIESGDRAAFFNIRKHAPNAFVFGNLGAANLQKSNAVDVAKKAVDMIEANAIFIHFNALQEACQDGDTDFMQSLCALERICNEMKKHNVKVFAREVGFGLSKSAAWRFINAGVEGLDCSGAGGTSWSRVESMCSTEQRQQKVGQVFAEWGIKTAHSIRNVRDVSNDLPLIASGGIRNGLDIAKALYLGADLVAMARPMLLAAIEGEKAIHQFIEATIFELRVAMFASGAKDLLSLRGAAVT